MKNIINFENFPGQTKKTRNFYEVLGISPQASQAEIAEAFRAKLTESAYPDTTIEAHKPRETYTDLIMAYSILKSEDRRAGYDQIFVEEAPAGEGIIETDLNILLENIGEMSKHDKDWAEQAREILISRLVGETDEQKRGKYRVLITAFNRQLGHEATERYFDHLGQREKIIYNELMSKKSNIERADLEILELAYPETFRAVVESMIADYGEKKREEEEIKIN